MDELRSSLSNLCSLQCRLKTKLSPTLQRKQRDIFQWLKELDYLTFSSLLTVDLDSPELIDVSSLIQFILISEPKSLENICYLRWTVSNGQIRIERARGPSSLVKWKDEYELLAQIRVVWEGRMLMDLRFPSQSIVQLMLRLSDHQCLTRPPDKEGLYGLMWLRCQSRFSFAQLFVGLLELHFWTCWRERDFHSCAASVALGTATQPTVDTKRRLLREIVTRRAPSSSCSSSPSRIIESTGRGILRCLVTESSSSHFKATGTEVLSLYLQIMKQRIIHSWYDPTMDASPFRGPYRNLWALYHLISLPENGLWKFEKKTLAPAALQPDSLLVEALVSVPLLHSFSLYHEFKTRLREKLLSDSAASALLLEEGYTSSQKKAHPSSSKKRKKRSRRATKPPLAPSAVAPPVVDTATPSTKPPSPIFVCLTSAEVTPELIRSTHTTTLCAQILDSIISDILSSINFESLSEQATEKKVGSVTGVGLNVFHVPLPPLPHLDESPTSPAHGGNLRIPWIFEDWGRSDVPRIFSRPENDSSIAPHDWKSLEGASFCDGAIDDSAMSWIRNHLPHAHGSEHSLQQTMFEAPPLDIKTDAPFGVPSPRPDSKECSSLPASPRRDEGRNERAKSFTEPLRPLADPPQVNPMVRTSRARDTNISTRVGRMRSGSLDPSSSQASSRASALIFSFDPASQKNIPPRPASSSSERYTTRGRYHRSDMDLHATGFLSPDETSIDFNPLEDDDFTYDDPFQDTDSGLSFGIWSQDVETENSNTIPAETQGNASASFSSSPLWLALSCSLLRSHADTIVLRNIIALQKSFIIHPQSQFVIAPIPTNNGLYFPLSYYPGGNLPGYSNVDFRSNHARELEVSRSPSVAHKEFAPS
jgi:hypothetical protein